MFKTMKKITNLLSLLSLAALVALGAGCQTTRQTEDLLSAAGFKIMPASTLEQQTHLKTIPSGKITSVQRDGKMYFVYPDKAHQVIYVGTDAQFQEYQKLRLKNQMAAEQVEAAQMNADPSWGMWGGWGGQVLAPPLVR